MDPKAMPQPPSKPSPTTDRPADEDKSAPFAPRTSRSPEKQAAGHRLSWRKKLLIGAGVLAAVIIMANGAYWLAQRNDPADNTADSINSKHEGAEANPDALPPSTGPNALDTASLQKDLASAEGALTRSNNDQRDLDAILNDRPGTPPSSASLSTLKTYGDTEIARRLAVLYKLINFISNSDMPDGKQEPLNDAAGNEATTLVTLRMNLLEAKTVSGATDILGQLAAEYPAYTQVTAKLQIIQTAYDQQVTQQKLSNLQVKFASRIATAKDAGTDTTRLSAQLQEMRQLLSAAGTTSSDVENAVFPLTPTNYDNDHGIMGGYRDSLKSAGNDTQAAYNLAKEIIARLDR